MLPGYRVHRLLGVGASSAVWSATGPDGGDVALKVVPLPEPSPGDGPWELARRAASATALQREITALTRVAHPRVVALRAVVPQDGAVVLVLDRAAGGSLGALVRARGSLDVGEVIELVAGLAGVLSELHDRGLVHGDVSPGNVLFDADGQAVLADLGLASLVGAMAQGPAAADPGALVSRSDGQVWQDEAGGTPGFADPAATTDRPLPSADVHGLAAVAWFALTSAVPGPAAHRVPLPLLVPEVPGPLVQVLDAALSPVPAHRPSAARLAEVVAGSGPSLAVHLVPSEPDAPPAELLTHRLRAAAAAAQEEEAAARGSRWRRGRWGLAAVAGVAAVFVGAWVVSGWILGPSGPLSAAGGGRPDGQPSASSPAPGASEASEGSGPAREPAPAPSPTADPEPGPTAVDAMTDPALADPEAVVVTLARARARALEAGDLAMLDAVDASGSAAHRGDSAAITALASAGARVDDLTFDVVAARVVGLDEAAGTARVEAEVITGAHEQRLPDGTVTDVPVSEPVTSVLVLELTDDGWRVDDTA